MLGFAINSFGGVQFLISPADLQAGRFEPACGVFDRYSPPQARAQWA